MIFLGDEALDHLRAVTDEPDLGGTKYRMLRPLGRGGMGTVYAVEDTELGREVALKVSSVPEVQREAQLIAQLEHPGIVPVHDVGTLPDGRVFYVMKLVRGERLDRWIAQGRELRAVLHLFLRICEAVAFAHSRGAVHRDLKPQNVMVGEFGEALVMDWGAPGTALGTAGFMPPEQARGEPVDARADVHALGAMLSVALRAPPKPLVSICRKATAELPKDRYSSALELAEDVRAFLEAMPVRAHRESTIERMARFASKHRVVLSLLGAYLLVRILIALAG
jgi:eukaryotic-like serine/threonine-protein kinase